MGMGAGSLSPFRGWGQGGWSPRGMGRTFTPSLVCSLVRTDGRKSFPVFYRTSSPSGPLLKSRNSISTDAAATHFSDGRDPGSVVGGGGGADILAPPPPPTAVPSSSPALRGDSSGTPGVQILTGWPPNNAGLAADAATKLTILEEIGRKREKKQFTCARGVREK